MHISDTGPPQGGSSAEFPQDLGLRNLYILTGQAMPLFRNGITGPWGEIVSNELQARRGALEGLRTYRPSEVEMPPYEDPARYMAQARRTNINAPETHISERLQAQRRVTNKWAADYVARPQVLSRLSLIDPLMNQKGFTDFFAANLFETVVTAHSVAEFNLETTRSLTLRQRFPDIRMADARTLLTWAIRADITDTQVQDAQTELSDIAYRLPYPDFFRLSAEQQTAIVETLGQEWEALCTFIHHAAPALLRQEATRSRGPLGFLPLRTLTEVIAANPDANATRICSAFLRSSKTFERDLPRVLSEARLDAIVDAGLRGMGIVPPRSSSEPEARLVEQTPELGLLRYDHAQITVGEQGFFLATDRANSILAARILQALAESKANQIDGKPFITQIWRGMPESERRLFTARKGDLRKQSGILDAQGLSILRTLTRLLGVTHETSGERFQIRTRPTVALHVDPQIEGIMGTLTPIFPPGTVRESMYDFAGDTPPQDYIDRASEILQDRIENEGQATPLTSSQALSILTFITDRNGKRGLLVQLEKSQPSVDKRTMVEARDKILVRLHAEIQRTLGEAYEGAYRERMVGGFHALGDRQVGLVSRHLPGVTKATTTITKQWYIGLPRR